MFDDLKKEVDQIWAEAVQLYTAGAKLYLTGTEADEALKQQREHADDSPKTGLIIEYLDKGYPINWNDMDIFERRNYLDGNDDDFGATASVDTTPKYKTCVIEIWCELFKGDPKALTPLMSREINEILRIFGWLGVSKRGPTFWKFIRNSKRFCA